MDCAHILPYYISIHIIFFLFLPQKGILWVLIRSASLRRFCDNIRKKYQHFSTGKKKMEQKNKQTPYLELRALDA